jgi:hypothetical protein
MTHDSDLLAELDHLIELIQSAPIVAAFDSEGNGPILSIADNHLFGDDGPIRKQAARVRELAMQAELDRELAERMKGEGK